MKIFINLMFLYLFLTPRVVFCSPTNDLIAAASAGDIVKVKKALKEGANAQAKNADGWSALMFAEDKEFKDIEKLLIAASADVDFMKLVASGSVEAIQKQISEGANVNKIIDGDTPLMVAASKNNVAVVELLLKKGATVNTQSTAKYDNGSTALKTASALGNTEVVKLLLLAKADVNITDKNGSTAIFIASLKNKVEIVDLLIKAKANLNTINKGGWTALNSAQHEGNSIIVAQLQNAGAKIVKTPYVAPKAPVSAVNVAKTESLAAQSLTPRQIEILKQVKAIRLQIFTLEDQISAARQNRPKVHNDAAVIAGQSCNKQTGVCTNRYQGGTESVGSYYARQNGPDIGKMEREIDFLNEKIKILNAEGISLDK